MTTDGPGGTPYGGSSGPGSGPAYGDPPAPPPAAPPPAAPPSPPAPAPAAPPPAAPAPAAPTPAPPATPAPATPTPGPSAGAELSAAAAAATTQAFEPPRRDPEPPPRPAVPTPPPATPTPTPAAATPPATATPAKPLRTGKPRRARLVVRRVDPWSVLKFSLLFSLCLLVVFVVAVAALYYALDALGVFDSVNQFVRDLTQANSGGTATGGYDVTFSSGRIIGGAAVIGLINVVIITAISTLGAFLYNLCGDIVGGIEVTLAERE
ncbi:MAG TPA: DUF3566 domain-containing protein [Mycobacteriales bacterium]|nr:DUF3566 domain-containing protein [Mycobacteriales bacterium]